MIPLIERLKTQEDMMADAFVPSRTVDGKRQYQLWVDEDTKPVAYPEASALAILDDIELGRQLGKHTFSSTLAEYLSPYLDEVESPTIKKAIRSELNTLNSISLNGRGK